MRAKGTVTTTGRPFTTTSVQIIRIRDGHILHSRADERLAGGAVTAPVAEVEGLSRYMPLK
jgi:hypothetical protein